MRASERQKPQTSRWCPGADGQIFGDPSQELLHGQASVPTLQELPVRVGQVELQGEGDTRTQISGPVVGGGSVLHLLGGTDGADITDERGFCEK